jgi:predicted transcriptional regulator
MSYRKPGTECDEYCTRLMTIRITPQLDRELDAMSGRQPRRRSVIVRRLLRQGLDRELRTMQLRTKDVRTK